MQPAQYINKISYNNETTDTINSCIINIYNQYPADEDSSNANDFEEYALPVDVLQNTSLQPIRMNTWLDLGAEVDAAGNFIRIVDMYDLCRNNGIHLHSTIPRAVDMGHIRRSKANEDDDYLSNCGEPPVRSCAFNYDMRVYNTRWYQLYQTILNNTGIYRPLTENELIAYKKNE